MNPFAASVSNDALRYLPQSSRPDKQAYEQCISILRDFTESKIRFDNPNYYISYKDADFSTQPEKTSDSLKNSIKKKYTITNVVYKKMEDQFVDKVLSDGIADCIQKVVFGQLNARTLK